jgi:twitching motility protein PilT
MTRISNAVDDQKSLVLTMLSQVLVGIISQQLVPRKTPIGQVPLWAQNKIAVPEILLLTPAIANQIREGKIEQIDNTILTSGAAGMRTRDQSLQKYFKDGLITQESVAKYGRGQMK